VADILLAHSYHLAYDPKQVRKMQPYPPLGTLYAAAALRAQRISAAVFDPMLQDPVSGFPTMLQQEKPKILAIYEDDFNFLTKMCLTRMRELAWQLAQAARGSGAIVIAHGSDATDNAKEYLENGVDFVLVGEAEQSLVELCAAILQGGALPTEIPGVLHLDVGGRLVQSPVKLARNSGWKNLRKPARLDLGARSLLHQRCRQPWMPLPLQLVRQTHFWKQVSTAPRGAGRGRNSRAQRSLWSAAYLVWR
jgi:anaerobic magnesium-protoporphyrin IX monomethyl ester cyclase